MTLFSLRSSTALVALSVSLSVGLPLMAPAQEPPAAQSQSEGWQEATQFGLRFGLPPGVTQIRDLPGHAVYSDLDDRRANGVVIEIQQFDSAYWQQLNDLGPEGVISALNARHLVEVAREEQTIRVGDRDFALYRGTGTLEDASGEPVERQVLFLVSMDPDSDGNTLLIGVVGVGLGGAASGALEAEFIRSLDVDGTEDDGTDDEQDGAVEPEDTAPAIAMAEPEAPGVTMATPQSEGVTLAENAADEAGEAGADTMPEAEADTAMSDAESAAPETAAPPDPAVAALQAILAEIGSMPGPDGTLAEGWTRHERFGLQIAAPETAIIIADRGPGERREFVLRENLTEVEGGSLEFATLILSRDDVDAVPGDEGFTAIMAPDHPERVAESPRRVMIGDREMRLYVVVGDPLPDGGDPSSVEIYLTDLQPDAGGDFLVLGYRARLTPLDTALGAYARYLQALAPVSAEAAQAEPDAPETATQDGAAPVNPEAGPDARAEAPYGTPEGLTPDGWTRIDRFGLSLAMPPYAEIRNDRPEGPERGINLYHRDRSARTQFEAGIAIVPAAGLPGLPGDESFRAMLEGFADVPVTETGTVVMLGGVPFRLYTAEGMREYRSDLERQLQGFYLAGAPDPETGDVTLIGGSMRGYAPEVAVETLTALMRSLSAGAEAASSAATDTAPERAEPPTGSQEAATEEAGAEEGTPAEAPAEATAPTTLLTGAVSLALPEGLAVTGTRRGDTSVDMQLGQADSPELPRVRIAAGMLDRPLQQQIARMLHSLQAVVETEIGGVPVWVIYGPSTRAMDNRRTDPDEDIPARLVIPAACTGDEPPYLVAMMTAPGDEALLDALQPTLALSVPAGATPCAPELLADIRAAISAPAAAQEPGIAMPPPPTEPGGEDATGDAATDPATDPSIAVGEPHPGGSASLAMAEARAWEEALRIGTPEAVLAFLAQYPRGLHSGEARGWLHARDIYAPDEYRPDPSRLPETPDGIRAPSEAEAWTIALADGRAEGVWTSLKAHPAGAHAAAAQLMLSRMLRGQDDGEVVRDPGRPPAPEAPRPDPGPVKR
ncbi:hypothetical protein [Pararhodobacter marinus]|uniref:hypothetical protein n=1 Tax=Pararhodobacter marinus TaxID=2184063 RepID=UPI003515275B